MTEDTVLQTPSRLSIPLQSTRSTFLTRHCFDNTCNDRSDSASAPVVGALSIVAMEPGGPAASSGRLSVGDRLLAVDDWNCSQQVFFCHAMP